MELLVWAGIVVWAVSLLSQDLSTLGLSAGLYSPVFGVWLGLVRFASP